jgi:hypothetical protein
MEGKEILLMSVAYTLALRPTQPPILLVQGGVSPQIKWLRLRMVALYLCFPIHIHAMYLYVTVSYGHK